MLLSASFVAVFSLVKLISLPCILGSPQVNGSAVPTNASSQAVPTADCDTYQILGARGTGEPQGSTSLGYAHLIKIVEATIPGGSNMEIQYSSSPEYVKTPMEGAHTAASYLTSQALKCPDQKYVFVGYSKGAILITELINLLPANTTQLAAVVLFGNPFHTPDAPQNQCSGTGGSGLSSRWTPPIPSTFIPLIYDCCLQGDMICQTKGSFLTHMEYSGSKDEMRAAAFVISQLRSKLDGSSS